MFWKEILSFMLQDYELPIVPLSLGKFLISPSPLTSAYPLH